MFGVDDARPGRPGERSHDELSEGGRLGQMEVDHVVAAGHQQPAQSHHPPKISVVAGTEGVHRRSARPHCRYQGILLPQDVGHLVVKPGPVHRCRHVCQQAFRPSIAQALDHGQHSQGSFGRLTRPARVDAHQSILPAPASRGAVRRRLAAARYCHPSSRSERRPACAGGEGDAFDGDSRGREDTFGTGQHDGGGRLRGSRRAAEPPRLSP